MARADLAALTDDDLAALTNRGTVKRALKEAETIERVLEEAPDGAITVKWGDGIECRIDAGVSIDRAHCSCNAAGLCRHLVRTVIAYRAKLASPAAQVARADAPAAREDAPGAREDTAGARPDAPGAREEAPRAPPLPQASRWDPGSISDASLAAAIPKPKLSRAKKTFELGTTAELVRSAKPTARLYQHAVTVRFLVEGDARYTVCDCAEPSPCAHVPLAIWSFRALPADQTSGVVETTPSESTPPLPLLEECERALVDLVDLGITGASEEFFRHFERLGARLRTEGLGWPADITADLIEEYELYRTRDALFRADRISELIGELLIRRDAITSSTRALPRFFLEGAELRTATRAGGGRYLGLGTSVEPSRHGPELVTHLLEEDTGTVLTVARRFRDPEDGEPKPWSELADSTVVRGVTWRVLGAGQLLAKGGKRSTSHRLELGRTPAVVHNQLFDWTGRLKPPLAAEDFEEVKAHLAALPPPSLRPRWVAGDVFAVPIARVESAEFSTYQQSVVAVFVDRSGGRATMIHPFTSRGAEGVEYLLSALTPGGDAPVWITARMSLDRSELVMRPLGIVLENASGRRMIQPWIERMPRTKKVQKAAATGEARATHPIDDFLEAISEEAAELVLGGLSRADYIAARRWRDLESRAEKMGSSLFLRSIRTLGDELEKKQSELRWTSSESNRALLGLLAHLELARKSRAQLA